jgi:hypothetical protein
MKPTLKAIAKNIRTKAQADADRDARARERGPIMDAAIRRTLNALRDHASISPKARPTVIELNRIVTDLEQSL